eukprot:5020036-Pyramimonas_sp.AAC.1
MATSNDTVPHPPRLDEREGGRGSRWQAFADRPLSPNEHPESHFSATTATTGTLTSTATTIRI